VFANAGSVAWAGALFLLAGVVAGGLIAAVEKIHGEARRPCFYWLSSLILTVVLPGAVGEPRAEGLTRLGPVALGRLLGLDRAPEVGTLRARMQALAEVGRSGELVKMMAAAHLPASEDLPGIFHLEGHVRAYHGRARLAEAHLARARLAMPGTIDTWVTDARGDGVMVWTGAAGAALSAELHTAMAEIRSLVGPDARPTLVFDRGGWSPKVFAEVISAGFHILTYRKGKCRPEPRGAFNIYDHVDDLGHRHSYHLADRSVRLAYKHAKTNRRLAMRQVTRLDLRSGHQTQVLTTHDDWALTDVAQRTFDRWRIENFFRYMRPHYALDALDSYAKIADEATRSVPNPAKAKAKKASAAARSALGAAQAALATADAANPTATSPAEATNTIAAATATLQAARTGLTAAAKAVRALPTRVPLGDIHPDAVLADPERKRITDVIRMATYNAESALTKAVTPPLPTRRRSPQPAARNLPGLRRHRNNRRLPTRPSRRPLHPPPNPGHRRPMQRAQRHRNPLPRHQPASRLQRQNTLIGPPLGPHPQVNYEGGPGILDPAPDGPEPGYAAGAERLRRCPKGQSYMSERTRSLARARSRVYSGSHEGGRHPNRYPQAWRRAQIGACYAAPGPPWRCQHVSPAPRFAALSRQPGCRPSGSWVGS